VQFLRVPCDLCESHSVSAADECTTVRRRRLLEVLDYATMMQPLGQAVFCEQPSVQSKYSVSPQMSGL